ncbi:hypothetical protein ONG05_002386 [Vibrio parahaemolyticus]|nr:hypothetical protein [Vibrio parahaemolyticus]
MEQKNPDLVSVDSPSQRIGAKPLESFTLDIIKFLCYLLIKPMKRKNLRHLTSVYKNLLLQFETLISKNCNK